MATSPPTRHLKCIQITVYVGIERTVIVWDKTVKVFCRQSRFGPLFKYEHRLLNLNWRKHSLARRGQSYQQPVSLFGHQMATPSCVLACVQFIPICQEKKLAFADIPCSAAIFRWLAAPDGELRAEDDGKLASARSVRAGIRGPAGRSPRRDGNAGWMVSVRGTEPGGGGGFMSGSGRTCRRACRVRAPKGNRALSGSRGGEMIQAGPTLYRESPSVVEPERYSRDRR